MQKTFITRRLLLFVGTLFCQLAMFAQSQVTGTVSDEHGEPIIGASVSVKGGSTGAVTDLDGKYSIPTVAGNATLVFTYVGFETVEIPVNNQSVINATMKEDNNELNEIVVVGYGTMKKCPLDASTDLQASGGSITGVGGIKLHQLVELYQRR